MKPKHDKRQAPAATNNGGVQGEGNYEAARAFNEAERRFVASGKVPAAARAAAPKSQAEQQAMLAAEQEGKSRAKDRIPPTPPTSVPGAAEPGVNAPGRKRS